MEFNEHKAIYLQIAETLCERILIGKWKAEERIPSVRELGASLGVNPNTVARTYDYLQQMNVIYNKRGIGYFVTSQAREEIVSVLKTTFLKEELPKFFKKMNLLSIPFDELETIYKQNNQ
ncbi:MAG: GntR family transcriptional regulator [Bacteroidales bacterium]|jgi:DNA-binding transcriptional regulator YhcF (GntR family)|nr:GntR family transcriptional regulator [Bacteroidales bacterium]